MAGRSFSKLLGALDPGVVLLGISFQPNGAGAITDVSGRGVASVAWDAGTSRYIVTLQDQYTSLLAAEATLALGTAAGQFAQLGPVSLSSKTFAVGVWDITGAALTTVAAGANNRIHLTLVLKNSSV